MQERGRLQVGKVADITIFDMRENADGDDGDATRVQTMVKYTF